MTKRPASSGESPRPENEAKDEIPDALAALFERARGRLIERARILHEMLGELERDALTQETSQAAKREAHKLAGSLGTYGLGSGSVAAREIEMKLDEGTSAQIDASWLRARVEHIDKLLHQTETVAEKAVTADIKPGSVPGPVAVARSVPSPSRGKDQATAEPVPTTGKSAPSSPASEARSTGGTGLDPLIDAWIKDLGVLEEAAADLVRQADRRVVASSRREAKKDMDLRSARDPLQRSIRSMEAVGLDAPVVLVREILSLLPDSNDPSVSVSRLPRFADRLFRLQQALEQCRPSFAESTSPVWVVSMDGHWGRHVAAALEHKGYPTRIADGVPRLAGSLVGNKDTLGVILDAAAADPESLQRLGPSLGDIPTILALSTPTLSNRVTAGRAGVNRVVQRSRPPHELAATFANLAHQHRAGAGRILVVDDDVTILEMVQSTLQHAGFEVNAVEGPEGFWDALETHRPDLIVTDLDMPGTDGADLCLALRTDPRWENLPVVFLSAQQDTKQLRRVFDSGADDFVPKPVDPATLVTRVRARLRRHHARRTTGHLDPVTRLPTGRSFQDSVERLLTSAGQEKRTVTFAVVALNDDPRLRAHHGGIDADRLQYALAHRLSGLTASGALVGRLELDRFLVAFSGLDRHEARPLLEDTLSLFHEKDPGPQGAGVTASAGLAQLEHHGTTLAGLVAAAEEARQSAEDQGVPLYTAGGGNGGPLEQVDVLVVDDDETIGMLLQDALGQKGWRVRWEPESKRALERLSGEHADLRARVVLLDVNMPGMDGLTMLRLLSERGVVPPMRVVMLTVRAREDEVVQALDLGAVDHVAKPFNVPVLMSRLERAMGG